MGVVYEAIDSTDQTRVALKVMNDDVLDRPKSRRRFEREAEVGSQLNSPYVVRTIAYGEIPSTSTPWMAMEFAPGRELSDLISNTPDLPLEARKSLLIQLLEALSTAHQSNIVHRDLKPENILVDGQPPAPLQLKVLDFGIAKNLSSLTGMVTNSGLGTPLWTAPEQAKDNYQPKPQDDLWALGLITFYVLTGKHYWIHVETRSSLVDLSLELLQSEIVPASERAKTYDCQQLLPHNFDSWFARCVHRDANQRFSNATEALQAFYPLFDPPFGERHRRLLFGLTLVSIVIVVLGLFLLYRVR
jgi:eukaryotic-like serine/threonine-protein kinase